MKLSVLFVVGMLTSTGLMAQQSKSAPTSTQVEQSFDSYCLQHATSIIQVSDGKSPVVAGKVNPSDKKNPTYVDYGVSLKENEAQYFSIEGTNSILKVESVFRLKLMYNKTK